MFDKIQSLWNYRCVKVFGLVLGLSVFSSSAMATTVIDDWQSGNSAFECSRIEGGPYQYSWKLDRNAPNGYYPESGAGISIYNSDNHSFNWSAETGIGAVIVKAGQGANVYYYQPPATNGWVSSYQNKEVSHVTFCWNPPPQPAQWCSPGYWKQDHHLDSWPSWISPNTSYNSVFDPDLGGNPSLLQVLRSPNVYGGGLTNQVADYLSDQHPDINYQGWRPENSCPLN